MKKVPQVKIFDFIRKCFIGQLLPALSLHGATNELHVATEDRICRYVTLQGLSQCEVMFQEQGQSHSFRNMGVIIKYP